MDTGIPIGIAVFIMLWTLGTAMHLVTCIRSCNRQCKQNHAWGLYLVDQSCACASVQLGYLAEGADSVIEGPANSATSSNNAMETWNTHTIVVMANCTLCYVTTVLSYVAHDRLVYCYIMYYT